MGYSRQLRVRSFLKRFYLDPFLILKFNLVMVEVNLRGLSDGQLKNTSIFKLNGLYTSLPSHLNMLDTPLDLWCSNVSKCKTEERSEWSRNASGPWTESGLSFEDTQRVRVYLNNVGYRPKDKWDTEPGAESIIKGEKKLKKHYVVLLYSGIKWHKSCHLNHSGPTCSIEQTKNRISVLSLEDISPLGFLEL